MNNYKSAFDSNTNRTNYLQNKISKENPAVGSYEI